MKRLFDIIFSIALLFSLSFFILFIVLFVKLTSSGPIFYWSDRVGQYNKIFKMPKFRTMKTNTPILATNLLKDPAQYLTSIGYFLRKSSLDEIPQLWSILIGDMSFVGPRPALFNQYDLIQLRTRNGIHQLIPGLTGWAQVNGRDNLTIVEKVNFDAEYLNNKNFIFDLKILYLTFIKIIQRDGVHH